MFPPRRFPPAVTYPVILAPVEVNTATLAVPLIPTVAFPLGLAIATLLVPLRICVAEILPIGASSAQIAVLPL